MVMFSLSKVLALFFYLHGELFGHSWGYGELGNATGVYKGKGNGGKFSLHVALESLLEIYIEKAFYTSTSSVPCMAVFIRVSNQYSTTSTWISFFHWKVVISLHEQGCPH
jgi:hypothetical protein